MGQKRHCTVRGCVDTSVKLFRFPLSDELKLKKWLNFLDDPSVFLKSKTELGRLFLCVHHFEDIYVSRNYSFYRLVQSAVPTLNPPTPRNHATNVPPLKVADSTKDLNPQPSTSGTKQKDLQPCLEQTPACIVGEKIPKSSDVKHISSFTTQKCVPEKLESAFIKDENTESAPALCIMEDESSCLSDHMDVEMQPSPTIEMEQTEDSDSETSSLAEQASTPNRPTLVKPNDIKKAMRILKALKTKCNRLQAIGSMSRVDRLFIKNRIFLKKISSNLSVPVSKLVLKEFERVCKHPAPDTWTWNDKVLALSILKRNPESYSFLQNLITLPSRDTLTQVLDDFNIEYGLNQNIMIELRKNIITMKHDAKNCIVMFDEIPLAESVDYNVKKDRIDGFENLGECGATNKVATHALVFMVRGLNKTWKQPLCFYMSCGPTPPGVISQLIVKVIEALINIKLNPVAIVCDERENNVITFLSIAEEDEPCFVVNGRKIVYIYDSPRLLNNIRNKLVEMDIRFVDEEYEMRLAKWEHIISCYQRDASLYKVLCKLTDAHLNPTDKNRNKVKYAAQVFSHTVYATMNYLVKSHELPAEAEDTAKFLKLMDGLFDSFNGNRPKPDLGKDLICWLRTESKHFTFWHQHSRIIESMVFIDAKNGNMSHPQALKGWLHNIRAVRLLWHMLTDSGYPYICMRHLNLEPLDNFFGLIRQFSNDKPSARQFIAAYKTAILNDLTCSSPMYETCEADDGKLLCDLKSLSVHIPSCSVKSVTTGDEAFKLSFTDIDMALLVKQSNTYIAGYIVFRLANAGLCKDCLLTLRNQESSEDFLIYPSPACVKFVTKSTEIMMQRAKFVFHGRKVGAELREAAVAAVGHEGQDKLGDHLGCGEHSLNLFETILRLLSQFVIYKRCRKLQKSIRKKNKQSSNEKGTFGP